jgi:hypothetical protein
VRLTLPSVLNIVTGSHITDENGKPAYNVDIRFVAPSKQNRELTESLLALAAQHYKSAAWFLHRYEDQWELHMYYERKRDAVAAFRKLRAAWEGQQS